MDRGTQTRRLGRAPKAPEALGEAQSLRRFRIYGGHAFGEILPPANYGPTHPEYYALANGKRAWEHFDGKHGAQPCTTNPDVVRLTVQFARRFFDRHPDFEAFAVSLNDGGGFYECDRCRRLDSGAQATSAGDPEGGQSGRKPVITDRLVTLIRSHNVRAKRKRGVKYLL